MLCSLKTPCRKWLSFECPLTLVQGDLAQTILYFSSQGQQSGCPSVPAVSGSQRQVWLHHHQPGTETAYVGPSVLSLLMGKYPRGLLANLFGVQQFLELVIGICKTLWFSDILLH